MIASRNLFPTVRSPVALLTTLVLVFSAGAARTQGEEKKPAAKPKSKKIILFDGKTLKGWKKTNFGGEGEAAVCAKNSA